MDIGNQMENVCLCSVMYVGSEIDDCVIVEYTGCVDAMLDICCHA